MSYLLTKVQAAGYKVADTKNAKGTRIICVQGGPVWFRVVIPSHAPRYFLEHVVNRCHRLINNPVE